MNRSILCSFLFLFVILSALSCKKKKNDNPFGGERVATIDYSHAGAILHYRIFYDNYNNVDSMDIIGDGTSAGSHSSKKFRYFGTSYSITDESNFTLNVLINSNDQISKILIADTTSLIYNNNQLADMAIWSPKATYPFYTINHIYYEWVNGDVTTVGEQKYSYNNSKNGQPGDAIRMEQFLIYGRSYIKTTHLPSSRYIPNSWTENFSYEFDSKGRISKFIKRLTEAGSVLDSSVYNYTYY
jgi:hypothetical protein